MTEKNKQEVEYFIFDAKGRILGRLATEIAKALSGKSKVDYTPNLECRDIVVVINADKVRLSGISKPQKKTYWRHSGYPGGIYKRTFEEQMDIDSTEVIKHAVKGMVPKNKLGRNSMKRLKVYAGAEHPYEDKMPQKEKAAK